MNVEVEISVEADALDILVSEAFKELNALHQADWKITNVRVWGRQDAASRNDGLVTIFNATVTATATVDLP